MIESQIIFRYPDQKFVGLATRRSDTTLDHLAFTLMNVLPKIGDTICERKVVELLTDEKLLKERSAYARVDKIEVIAVLARQA
jgi:hypothetical protein